MKENKYDDTGFFEQYGKMDRSVHGLTGAGEWHVLKCLLPDLTGKSVLDLGCGYGWHCKYAADMAAERILGLDISKKMIGVAQSKNNHPAIEYKICPVEDFDYPSGEFDVVISSLTLHYIGDISDIFGKIYHTLTKGGTFIFSVEHPVFTAQGEQKWITDDEGSKLHWPVDRYFDEGPRTAFFLGHEVIKYHRTLTTYIHRLIAEGFRIDNIVEPQPSPGMVGQVPGMADELRRPMMLIISAIKD